MVSNPHQLPLTSTLIHDFLTFWLGKCHTTSCQVYRLQQNAGKLCFKSRLSVCHSVHRMVWPLPVSPFVSHRLHGKPQACSNVFPKGLISSNFFTMSPIYLSVTRRLPLTEKHSWFRRRTADLMKTMLHSSCTCNYVAPCWRFSSGIFDD